jgi:hypothetical protein
MADIHVYTPDEQRAVYPEERVIQMLQSGELPPNALYWRVGMDEWQPLSLFRPSSSRPFVPDRRPEALSEGGNVPLAKQSAETPADWAPTTAQNPKERQHVRRFHFRRKPEPLTTIVQTLIVICIVLAALELADTLVHYNLVRSETPVPNAITSAPAWMRIMDDMGWMLLAIFGAVNLFLIIPYCVWLYRTNLNSRNFSFIMHFTPEWTVGSQFVPVINFFMPCQAMQELWKVSRNPRTWHNDRPSVLVGMWWMLALAATGLLVATGVLALRARSHDDLVLVIVMFMIVLATLLAFYGTWLAVISVITQNQIRLVNPPKRKRNATAPPSASTP